MKELFSLGKIHVSDFIQEQKKPVEMKLFLTEDGAVRLGESAPLNTMYGRYWYRSSVTDTMRSELKDIVDSIFKVVKLKENDLFIDIACNDGTLLSYVPKHLIRVGVDPADDSFREESQKHAHLIIQDFFTAAGFKKSKFGKLKAKVITSIAVFYDVGIPEIFIKDVDEVLDDNGLWVMQLSYTPLMLEQLAFDNIVHEHLFYYSLFNLKSLLERNGFKIMDANLNDTNGGSFRVYIMKQSCPDKYFSSQPYRDVCNFRMRSLLKYEKSLNLTSVKTWSTFFNKVNELKQKTVSFIKAEKKKGKTIYAYGASTKGNTLLQYFGLDNTIITAIAERSIEKWGLITIATNIPIISEEEMRKAKPDYLLILPWHFINEFLEREAALLLSGTKFIVPCPKFEIITA